MLNNSSYLKFVNLNSSFFQGFHDDLLLLFKSKEININFKFGGYSNDFLAVFYLFIVTKPLYSIESPLEDLNYLRSGINRNVFIKSVGESLLGPGLIFPGFDFKTIVLKLTIVLQGTNLIVSRRIITYLNKGFDTQIYLQLNTPYSLSTSNRISIKRSHSKFRFVGGNYIMGQNITTLLPIFKKSKFQKSFNTFDKNVALAASQTRFKLNYVLWEKLKPFIFKEFGFLKETNNQTILTLYDDVLHLIQHHQKDFNKLTESISNFYNGQKKLQNRLEEPVSSKASDGDVLEEGLKIKPWGALLSLYKKKKKISLELKNLKKKLQQLFYFLVAEEGILVEGEFFIGHYFDFRGRLYPKSLIHPMYNRLLRSVVEIQTDAVSWEDSGALGPHSSEENLEKYSNNYKKKFLSEAKLTSLLNKKIEDYGELSEKNLFLLYTVFLEAGKLFKLSLMKEGVISLQSFIAKGESLILDETSVYSLDLEDQAYLLKLKYEYNIFCKTGVWNNFTINRDAPASSLQHWGSILKPKTPEVLEKINLNGQIWSDIYTILIGLFFEHFGDKDYLKNNKLKALLTRKTLKRTIMTINYNATLWRCNDYFITALPPEYKNNPDEEKLLKDAYSFMQDFYEFIRCDVFKILFDYDKLGYLNSLDNQLNFDKKNIDLRYYNINPNIGYQILKIKRYRWKISCKELTNILNIEKTAVALPANVIQAHDAHLAHFIILNIPCYAIHDAFGVPIDFTPNLMGAATHYFSKKLNCTLYPLFIFL